jgi:hypothetical protein
MKAIRIVALAALAVLGMASCSRSKSSTTGMNLNDKKNGGFQINLKYKGQKTGPGLVFIEGGSLMMGRVEEDFQKDWNNQPTRVTVASFYMDENEVTNADYREYLYWLRRVYDYDYYPEIYTSALPDTLVWRNKLGYNETYVENYLRHPAYNFYPVVGVNWLQSMRYCSWRTDRVNEQILIDKGVLRTLYDQKDDQNFNTETYLYKPNEYTAQNKKGLKDLNPNSGYGKEGRPVRIEDGILLPTDAKTAENFRKFVNENWDRKSANLHRQLKEAVDTDVLANLDTNTPFYKDARALVELRKNTLDNPNGISKILDAEGPKGINRKVQIEKIAQNIADMPVDQFTHVIDTLKGVPPELQPQATAALSEIKAQFANRVAEQKTPRQVTKYMNDNREVMNRVFTPDEIANLRDYHNAVHILATDTGYKGAAVQAINIEKRLARKVGEQVVSKGAALGAETLTGGQTYGAAALMTNEALSQKFAARQARAQAKAEKEAFQQMQTRFVPISDLLPKNRPGAGSTLGEVSKKGQPPRVDIVAPPRIDPTLE